MSLIRFIHTVISSPKIRFGLVGILNTLIDFAIYTALNLLGMWFFVANLVSTSSGMLSSFFLNKHFTFQHKSRSTKKMVLSFLLITAFGQWLIQPAVIDVARYPLIQLQANTLCLIVIPKMLGIVISLVWNYLWYSRRIFNAS